MTKVPITVWPFDLEWLPQATGETSNLKLLKILVASTQSTGNLVITYYHPSSSFLFNEISNSLLFQ